MLYNRFALHPWMQSMGLYSCLVMLPLTSFAVGEENLIPNSQIRFEYASGEIPELCRQAILAAKTKYDQIAANSTVAQVSQTAPLNPLLEFEKATAQFVDSTAQLSFMKDVSTDSELRKEGSECEEKAKQFSIEIFTREDLYIALKNQTGIPTSLEKLRRETLKAFEDNGFNLDTEKRALVKAKKLQLSDLETEFNSLLNEDKSTVEYTEAELEGVPSSFFSSIKKTAGGTYIVPVNGPNYVQLMENATQSETRHKFLFAYENRAASTNTELYESAVVLRNEIAQLLGYSSWAEYKLRDRMAKKASTALSFLNDLRSKLTIRNQADLGHLLELKKEMDSTATRLNAWDLRYFAYQLKKKNYELDNEVLRQYFPQDYVVQGMFHVYSQILGVNFTEIVDAPVWAKGVKFYQVTDLVSHRIVGYFYMDFIPREGKYGHAAAFPLRQGRQLDASNYLAPISSIVANFSPPEGDAPALLTHDEVETLFHEFGHIMHMTLTQAPFATLAGANVATDFVEAPSQMLENWVYSPEVLNIISSHYKTGEKIPADLTTKLVQSRNFNQGYFYTRQLVFGLFDMISHTSKSKVDATKLYNELHMELVGIPVVEGGHFIASFGHMMGGYDAGYYGYLWSDVYAADMFTRFQADGLLNSKVGADYRQFILEKGGTEDALDLVTRFLGRTPNSDAFFHKLLDGSL